MLRWMRRTVHTVSTYSIYRPGKSTGFVNRYLANRHLIPKDSDTPQSLTPRFLHTLELMLEKICSPSILVTTINPGLEYADWISHNAPSTPTSKLRFLCTSAFQSIAGYGLGHSFIKDFRLLLWITSLFYIAMNKEIFSQNTAAHETALKSLRRLINACGGRAVLRLDELCHPRTMNNMSVNLQIQLFLVIIGVCLSAAYRIKDGQRLWVCLRLEQGKPSVSQLNTANII